MNFKIKVIVKGKEIATHPLRSEQIIIGRGSKATIEVKDDGISRRHLQIDVEKKEKIYLTDLGSSNGTFIGANRLKPNEKVEYPTFFIPVRLGVNVLLEFIIEAY